MDGLSTAWYKNGQVKYEKTIKNEKKHGIHKEWYQNGQLGSEYLYKDGFLHGLAKAWYSNGQIKHERYYQENIKKEETCWDINGNEWKCKD